MLSDRPITVLGAGIGGLTAALALARRGARVTVIERAAALEEVGAGLQISPNAMAVLQALGVGAAVAGSAPRAGSVTLLDALTGRRILRMELSRLQSRHGWHLVHRADLVAALADAAAEAGVALRTGEDVTAITQEDGAAWLRFGDGRREAVPLLVAADGVRSRARAKLDAEDGAWQAPPFTGQVAWRALVPLDAAAPPGVEVHLAPGRHLVAYPLRDRRVMNVVAVEERRQWAAEDWMQPDVPAAVQAAFADCAPPLRDLLAGVESVHLWGLFRHAVAARWHAGRVVLVGDAAHATLPFLAQGACMAIEDAWVLAAALDAAAAPEAGFARYQAARRARCVRIVAAADGNARAYHLGGTARTLAHAGLRLAGRIAPEAPLRRFDWLYLHDVTRG